ncbi:hypothetical protein BC834DRAFT_203180 [Gloeopeniophorella convolvens]|nr:hypothetical protein BC834DRAFT_203180 [Gloeopeniophorella convolvens]
MPMKILPAKLNLGLGARKPRLLWYGIGFNREHLIACAKRHGFWPESDEISYFGKLSRARYSAEHLLRALTGWRHLEIRTPYALNHERIVGIYSSYWINHRAMSAQDQARVLDIIRKELGVEGEPVWYFDRWDYDHDFLRSSRKRQVQIEKKEREKGISFSRAYCPYRVYVHILAANSQSAAAAAAAAAVTAAATAVTAAATAVAAAAAAAAAPTTTADESIAPN